MAAQDTQNVEFHDLACSSDGETAVVVGSKDGGNDAFVGVFDCSTVSMLSEVSGTWTSAWCVERIKLTAGDCFVVGFLDGRLRSFRQDTTSKALAIVEGPPLLEERHIVRSVAVSSTGRRLASTFDGTVCMWDVNLETGALGGGESVLQLEHLLYAVAWSPTVEHLLATGTSDGCVRLFNVRAGAGVEAVATMSKVGKNYNPAQCLAFDPIYGNTIAAGYFDGQVARWDVRAPHAAVGTPIKVHGDMFGEVRCMQYSSDGTVLATGSADNMVKLWDTTEDELVPLEGNYELKGHTEWVMGLEFNPVDPSVVLSCSDDGTVRRWDVPECAFRLPLEGPSPRDSPKRPAAAAGGGEGTRPQRDPSPQRGGAAPSSPRSRTPPRITRGANVTLRFGELVRLTSSLSLTAHRDSKTKQLIGFTGPRSQVMITPKDAHQVIHDMVVAKHGSAKACSLFQ